MMATSRIVTMSAKRADVVPDRHHVTVHDASIANARQCATRVDVTALRTSRVSIERDRLAGTRLVCVGVAW